MESPRRRRATNNVERAGYGGCANRLHTKPNGLFLHRSWNHLGTRQRECLDQFGYLDGWQRNSLLQHVIGGREGVTDPYGEWAARREVESTGCVLVRPDRHVAWRSTRYTPDSARQLQAVIEQALGRK